MPAFDTILLCTSPRSGSTLLCGLMEASGFAGRPDSFFRAEDLEMWAQTEFALPRDAAGRWEFADYLAAAKAWGRSPNGVTAVRLMAGSLDWLDERLDGLWPGEEMPWRFARAFGRIRAVHLVREDLVAQAVSRLKAEETGLWHRIGDWEERSHPPAEPRYDRGRIEGFIAEAEADRARWEGWFAGMGLEPLRLTYDALAADPGAAIRGLLSGLGMEPAPGAVFAPANERLADAVSAAWIARFRAGG